MRTNRTKPMLVLHYVQAAARSIIFCTPSEVRALVADISPTANCRGQQKIPTPNVTLHILVALEYAR